MLDLDITYEINGKKVNPKRLGNELEKVVLAEAANNIKKKLESVICAEHKQRPTVKIIGKNVNDLKCEVEGCCQQLIDDATAKLR